MRCHIGYKIGSAGAAAAAAVNVANVAATSNQGHVSSNQMNSNITTVFQQQQQQASKNFAQNNPNKQQQQQFGAKTNNFLDYEQQHEHVAAAPYQAELLSRQQSR